MAWPAEEKPLNVQRQRVNVPAHGRTAYDDLPQKKKKKEEKGDL